MTLVIPTGFGEAAIQFKHNSDPDPWYVTFGVDLSDVGGDYLAAMSSITAAWSDTLGIFQSSDVTLTGIRLTVGQDGPDNLTLFQPEETVGPASYDMLPQNCALLVQKVTSRPGRTGKGRMYIPGVLQEAKVNAVGGITGTFVTDLQTQAVAFRTTLATAPDLSVPTPMVLLHNGGVPGGTTPTPIEGLVVQSTIATQRRRLR